MALDPVVNFFRSQIATLPVASGGTVIVLSTGDGNKLPNPATDGAFNLTIYNADDPFVTPEIVRVTGRSGDTLTVTRAQEGTTATNKTAGSTWSVELTPTAKTIQDIDSKKAELTSATQTITAGKFVPSANTVAGNGMYLPAANTVAVSTNGVERLRVATTIKASVDIIAPNLPDRFNNPLQSLTLTGDPTYSIDGFYQFGSLSGSNKWGGGVLAPNGKIYGIPRNSTTVLEIDPATNTTTTFGSLSGSNKWRGGVLAPNGKIYGIPFDSTTVLEIDPATNTTTTFGSLSGSSKWVGGVLAPNGKIYGIPLSSTTVLEIDPVAQTTTTFGSLSGSNKWIGGVLAPNGKIYGIPLSSTTVLEIDPVAQTTTTFGSLSGSNKWVGGVLAPNGKIYGIPFDSTTVLEIDPVEAP
jgi:hypothetical protein